MGTEQGSPEMIQASGPQRLCSNFLTVIRMQEYESGSLELPRLVMRELNKSQGHFLRCGLRDKRN